MLLGIEELTRRAEKGSFEAPAAEGKFSGLAALIAHPFPLTSRTIK